MEYKDSSLDCNLSQLVCIYGQLRVWLDHTLIYVYTQIWRDLKLTWPIDLELWFISHLWLCLDGSLQPLLAIPVSSSVSLSSSHEPRVKILPWANHIQGWCWGLNFATNLFPLERVTVQSIALMGESSCRNYPSWHVLIKLEESELIKTRTTQSWPVKGYCVGNIIGKVYLFFRFVYWPTNLCRFHLGWCTFCSLIYFWIKAPQLWQAQYKPRNILPWSLILSCYVICSTTIIGMMFYLKSQNRLRDRKLFSISRRSDESKAQHQEHSETNNETNLSEVVDKAFMDLTDLENTGKCLASFDIYIEKRKIKILNWEAYKYACIRF